MAVLPSEDGPDRAAPVAGSPRRELVDALADAADRLSTQNARFNALVAQRAGIGESDLFCLRLLLSRGAATAGELTAATGLTSGATTGTMNRLEARGLARREPAPGDRRKTIVRPCSLAVREIAPIFETMHDVLVKALAGVSDSDVKIAHKVIETVAAGLLEETGRLAAEPASHATVEREVPQPLP